MSILSLPPVINCLPFVGPVISFVKSYQEEDQYRKLTQVAAVLRDEPSSQPTAETVQRATHSLNNQIFGGVGNLATIVSVIALAVLGIIALPDAIFLGLVYSFLGLTTYYFYDALRQDYQEILARG